MAGTDHTNHFEGISNFRRIPGTILYRSARPDKATENDVNKLKKLGVKRIIDFRNCQTGFREYHYATGEKLVDDVYQTYILKTPNKKLSDLKYYRINKKGMDLDAHGEVSISGVPRAHILFNLQEKLIPRMVKNYPRLPRWFALLLLLFDKMFKTLYFYKFITWYSVNPGRLLKSYIESVDYCGEEICRGKEELCLIMIITLLRLKKKKNLHIKIKGKL